MADPIVTPDPADARLTERVTGVDEHGRKVDAQVVVERPLTLYLNGQEIVTMMTVGDYPEYLGVGYLVNQNMLLADDDITEVEYDGDLEPQRRCIAHPQSVFGLGDGGAHCGVLCDASIPTYMLTYMCRDRTRGERLDLDLGLLGLDPQDDRPLVDGIAERAAPLEDGALLHRHAEPRHRNRRGQGFSPSRRRRRARPAAMAGRRARARR